MALHTDRDSLLADQMRVDSIPRSIVLDPDGTTVDVQVGYCPAAEYAAWLKSARSKPSVRLPAVAGQTAPPPAGAGEGEASLTVWFVDNDRVASTWNQAEAFRHPGLLWLLSSLGLKPRIEHMSRSDFPTRWQQAEAQHRLPDLISPTNRAGTIRDLEKAGRFRAVGSERLSQRTENAACQDFARRFLYLVRGSLHESNGRMAVGLLLGPGPGNELPGRALSQADGRAEAEQVASEAVAAYLAGEPEKLRPLASRRSSQLAECTRPGPSLRGMTAQTSGVDLRGNARFAVGLVEATFEGDRFLGGDPVAVVLHREDERWRVLAICRDALTVRDAGPALCALTSQLDSSTAAPGQPRIIAPRDGQEVGEEKPDLTWTIEPGAGPILAQVFVHLCGNTDEPEASWPFARLSVRPAEPSGGRVNLLAELAGSRMSGSVWAIGRGGHVALAPDVHYVRAPLRVK